jgi:tetratricopeptide (TPR) repeat protein
VTHEEPARDLRSRAAWARPAVLCAAVVALATAANLPALRGGFFADDAIYVTENPTLLEVPLTEPWRFFAARTNPWEYLPLRDLSYRVDVALFGLSPLGFRAVNLALYALACLACFLAARAVTRLLRGTRGDRLEDVVVVTTVAVFAAHPAHVEAVAWISGRKDLLSGLFTLASLWLFAEALAFERPSWRRIAAATALFSLALLSKAAVVPLAPLALLLAVARFRLAPLRVALVRAMAVAAPLVGVAAVSTWLYAHFATVQYETPGLERTVGAAPLALRILGTLAHIALAPFSLRIHYDVRVAGLAGTALVLAGLATAGAAAVGTWALLRRGSIAGFGVAAFAVFTVPMLQLVPYVAWSEASERYVFTPIFGLALAAGALAGWAAERWPLRPVAATGAVAVALGLAASAQRSAEWISFDRLASTNVERAPSHPAAVALAMTAWSPRLAHAEARAAASRLESPVLRQRILLLADGWQALAEGRRDDALRVVRALASFPPSFLTAETEGVFAEQAGDDFAAVRFFATRRADRPEPLRGVQERYRPQLDALERSIAARPADLQALLQLGNLQSELLLDHEASRTYRRILELAPELHAVRYNLGTVLRRGGLYAAAAAEYRLAARGIPEAWNELGTCERALGDVPAAVQAFRNALAADPRAWKPAYNLALAHEQAGQTAEARGALLVARQRATAFGSAADLALVDALAERLGR